jgi:hypothetical protein
MKCHFNRRYNLHKLKRRKKKNRPVNSVIFQRKASLKLVIRQTQTDTYLQNTDKDKCNSTRKSHMNHSECYWKWKIKIERRQNPLQ